MLNAEIGDPKYLDEFRPKEGQDSLVKAFGSELVLIVNVGNVTAHSVHRKNRNMLVKAAEVGRVAHGLD